MGGSLMRHIAVAVVLVASVFGVLAGTASAKTKSDPAKEACLQLGIVYSGTNRGNVSRDAASTLSFGALSVSFKIGRYKKLSLLVRAFLADDTNQQALDRLQLWCLSHYPKVHKIVSADLIARTTTTTTTTLPLGATIDKPLPKGIDIPAGDWKLTFLDFNPNASAQVASYNRFNDTPPPGQHYVALHIRATWNGAGTGNPFAVPRINLIGTAKTSYQNTVVSSGSGGDARNFVEQGEAPPGGAIDGWLYYLVNDNDVGLVAWLPNVTYTDIPGGIAYFALQ
jgi:hypothetical protein